MYKVDARQTNSLTALILACLVTSSLISTQAIAKTYQSLKSIQSAAEQHAIDQAGITSNDISAKAGRLDPRLKLSDCPTELETYSPPGKRSGARKTVGVRCNAEKPWSLFVPVTLSILKPVAVSSRTLPRGHILTADDLRITKQDIAGVRQSYFSDIRHLIGQKLKRDVQADTIITNRQVAAQQAVKRGDKVVIMAKSSSVQIHTAGKALESGAIGKRIRVTNHSSGKEIEATVIKPGFVAVSF